MAALWGIAAACPPALLLAYTLGARGARLRAATAAALTLGATAALAALTAAIVLAPPVFDYGAVLGKAYLFYDAQKSGPLGPGNRVPWRGDSAMHDAGPRGADLVGGFYDAGDHIKASMSIGVSASLLAWGLLEFPAAHDAAGQTDIAAGHIRHAAEYLLKCHTKDEEFVGQVREDWRVGRGVEEERERSNTTITHTLPPHHHHHPTGRRLQDRPRLLGPPRGHGRHGHGPPLPGHQRDTPGERPGGPRRGRAGGRVQSV